MKEFFFFGAVIVFLFVGGAFGAGTYSGGSGTEGDPYQISTAEQLDALGQYPNDWDKYFELVNDIDLSVYDGQDGNPVLNIIGNSTTKFTGTFDGSGKQIKNFSYPPTTERYIGIFGYLGNTGVIKNLGLINVNLIGDDYIGGLCGLNDSGSIINCYTTGSVDGGFHSDNLGGLCGYNNSGTIENCYSTVTVSGRNYIGGVCGNNNSGTIINSYSTGNVTAGKIGGGLCGQNSGVIRHSYSTGAIGEGGKLGGLCGVNDSGTIDNCYSDSTLIGKYDPDNIGGLCGINDSGTISNCYSTGSVTGRNYVGGLCGLNSSGIIRKCYSTGTVIRADYANVLGGFCGDNKTGTIEECYFYILSGPDNGWGVPLDIPGILDPQIYRGFDFSNNPDDGNDDYWVITEGQSPSLAWQNTSGPLPPGGPETTLQGSGYANDPFQINSYDDLMELSLNASLYCGYYVLNIDIDLSSNTFTTSVITGVFCGHFNGNDKVIRNLTIDVNGADTSYIGLFSWLKGSASNLTLENVNISGEDYVGGLCGYSHSAVITNCDATGSVTGSAYVGGLCGLNDSGTIDSSNTNISVVAGIRAGELCGYNKSGTIKSCCANGTVEGWRYVGNLCGVNEFGTINKCSSKGLVSGDTYIGGVCGDNQSGIIINSHSSGTVTAELNGGGLCGRSSGTISNCYSDGIVNVTDGSTPSSMGGLCGGNAGDIIKCYSTISISSQYSAYNIGGLCGGNGGNISDCYSTGSISGGRDSNGLGGFCGKNSGDITACYSTGSVTGDYYSHELGGFCGHNYQKGTISKCYSTGKVDGNKFDSLHVGGLCGKNEYGTIENCYSTGSVTGEDRLGGLCGMNYRGTIKKCYSTGIITGSSFSDYLGGLCGLPSSGTISDSYFYILSGVDNRVGTSLTGYEMLDKNSYTGFDFAGNTDDGENDIWLIKTGQCPELAWQTNDGPAAPNEKPVTTLSGSGTADDPFQINTPEDFTEFRNNASLNCGYYILNIDIDLTSVNFHKAVIDRLFGGHFNGNGKVIQNITINGGSNKDYLGLFKKTTASVSNLGVKGIQITCGPYGAYNGGLCGYNSGTIEKCYVTGEIDGQLQADHVGGLCGHNKSGTISNSYAAVSVSGGRDSDYLGGLCGYNENGAIVHSYATGEVASEDESCFIGGLCGNSKSGTIKKSYFYLFGGLDNSFGVSLSKEEIINAENFVGFDFSGNLGEDNDGIWEITAGHCPKLSWQSDDGPQPPTGPVTTLSGSGCLNDPFQINNLDDFTEFRTNTSLKLGYYVLNTNIDLYEEAFTTAVINRVFSGYFDGNSKVIKNATIDAGFENTDNLGFFRKTNGYIKNLGVEDLDIKSGNESNNIGGICGVNSYFSRIENCYSTGTITGGHYSDYHGGLCGINYGTISKSHSASMITGGRYCKYLGGLCGKNSGIIQYCYANCTVAGGFDSEYLGGLCGDNYASIRNSYTKGSVSGGLGSRSTGGLCGGNRGVIIENCFSASEVTGGSWTGGMIGNEDGSCYFAACFWDSTLNSDLPDFGIPFGVPNSDEVTGLTSTELKQQDTFRDAGWDFVGESVNGELDVWRLCVDGSGYPRLAWEYARVGDFVCADGVDMDDFAYFSARDYCSGCGGIFGSGGGVVDVEMLAELAGQWLSAGCGDCGGGDVTADGDVDMADFGKVAGQWLCSTPVNWDRCDLDGDGVVGDSDFDIWIGYWLSE